MEVKDIEVTLYQGILTVKGEKNRSMNIKARITIGLKDDSVHSTGALIYLERLRPTVWMRIIKTAFSD